MASKGIYVDLNVLIGKLNSKNGQTSMYDIIRVAKEYGITLYANKMSLNDLKKGDIVLININGHNHFVTIYSVGEDYVIYNDPDLGLIKIFKQTFQEKFLGYSLSLDKKESVKDNISQIFGGIFVVDDVFVGGAILLGTIGLYYSVKRSNDVSKKKHFSKKVRSKVKDGVKKISSKVKKSSKKGSSKKGSSKKGSSKKGSSKKSSSKKGSSKRNGSKKIKKYNLEHNNVDESNVWRRAMNKCSNENLFGSSWKCKLIVGGLGILNASASVSPLLINNSLKQDNNNSKNETNKNVTKNTKK